MAFPHLPRAPETLPLPADPRRAETQMETWRALESEADFVRALADDAVGAALLRTLFGNSPFLTQAALKEPQILRLFAGSGPEEAFRCALSTLHAARAALQDMPLTELKRTLRVAKRRGALAIALADIAGFWPLETITASLSRLAEECLQLAAAALLTQAARAGDFVPADPADPERDSGWIILAMGKLGSIELNYSSDIDLVVLYDEQKSKYTGSDNNQKFSLKLTRELVRIIEERTGDGYAFRTDLRLRPDPGVTQLAMSASAAEGYYESLGQNWERAAMIKARPVAGDIAAGESFLKHLRPFVWRKYLDFAAIQDIHSIKRQIHSHRGGGRIAVAGHNVKLGRGGIREIEFFCQTQQLIWGGRDPDLRMRGTEAALRGLVDAGHVDAQTAEDLAEAYRFLRRVEHRLQMIDDRQIHSLPESDEQLSAFATFLGYPDAGTFSRDFVARLERVQGHYAELFEDAPSLSSGDEEIGGSLVFTGGDDDPETLATIENLGFSNPRTVSQTIRGWHHGRYRATRSTRSRELLTELVPTLIRALGRTAQPDAAFARFDEFLSHLPAGVQIFSLFYSNPNILELVADLMSGSPRIAGHLSRRPALMEALLDQGFSEPPPLLEELEHELASTLALAEHYEAALDRTRRWANDRRFLVAVQLLRGHVDAVEAGRALSDIAEATIAGLLPHVEADFARRHGRIAGTSLAVVALGKLGSRTLSATSDLDLVFVYGDPPADISSDGDRPLTPGHYFNRLTQAVVTALTALTAEGALYDIDTRLRPSGGKGPLACSLTHFRSYQSHNAWTWEHQALTRARLIAGPEPLRKSIGDVVRDVLIRPREAGGLARDIVAMRARMRREHRGDDPWDIKNRKGGLIDLE
ncbi:MAG: bifunctional [glutamine synthetase] adenylyltransferase/[glutamine synthetase]-adenylyl-L-tyrosine phosphorylase, partial [Acetobacterales bacterium]